MRISDQGVVMAPARPKRSSAAEIARLNNVIQLYEAALQFYANHGNHRRGTVALDKGKLARMVLEGSRAANG